MEKNNSHIDEIVIMLSSLLGVFVAFNFYTQAMINNSESIMVSIQDALALLELQVKNFSLIMIVISSVVLLITFNYITIY